MCGDFLLDVKVDPLGSNSRGRSDKETSIDDGDTWQLTEP